MISFHPSNWFECTLESNPVHRVDLILGHMYILIWNMKFALIWRYHLVWNVAGFFIAQLTNSYIFTVLTDNSDSLWSYKYSVFLIFNNKIDIMKLSLREDLSFSINYILQQVIDLIKINTIMIEVWETILISFSS